MLNLKCRKYTPETKYSKTKTKDLISYRRYFLYFPGFLKELEESPPCVVYESTDETEDSLANQNTAMATTAEQQSKPPGGQDAIGPLGHVAKNTHSNSINSSRDSRGVRFADQDVGGGGRHAGHPKNKVLKRKNTPATLPKVDKIYGTLFSFLVIILKRNKVWTIFIFYTKIKHC